MRLLTIATCLLGAMSCPAHGITLAEFVAGQPPRLFVATKGAELPSHYDQTNNLKEGDRALLLSDAGLTDLDGISSLMVEDEGRQVPLASVKNVHLFANKNAITALPEEMGSLDNVLFLYFEKNRLSSLPPALAEMKSLQGMYFTDNNFAEIPSFVFGMAQLKKLQFAGNHISQLPEGIGQLTRLIHFNMAENQIAVIPDSIANLTRLRVCDLSDNPFTRLPDAFGNVGILYQLRVKNCPITTLPQGFANMPGTIDITGSKIDPASLPAPLQARLGTEKPPKPESERRMIMQRKAKPGEAPQGDGK